ncbi:MAG: hypothetical protein ACRCZF_19005, partial [Gemmataceae bacterium]
MLPRCRPALGLLLILFGINFPSVAPAAPPTDITTVQLSEIAYDFAMDAETGTVAAVVPDKDLVLVYPNFATDPKAAPKSISVGKRPVAVHFKKLPARTVWMVLCHDSSELAILNPTDFRVQKVIALPGLLPFRCTTSQEPNDPLLYSFNAKGEIGVLNLATESYLGILPKPRPSGGVISADGSRLYYPRGAEFENLVWEDLAPPREPGLLPTVTASYRHPVFTNHLRVNVHPHGSFVAFSTELWRPSLDQRLHILADPSFVISAARPVLFSYARQKLTATSDVTFKELGSVELPAVAPPVPYKTLTGVTLT